MTAPDVKRRPGASHGVDRIWQMWLDEISGRAISVR
jgi:hypothetical protein